MTTSLIQPRGRGRTPRHSRCHPLLLLAASLLVACQAQPQEHADPKADSPATQDPESAPSDPSALPHASDEAASPTSLDDPSSPASDPAASADPGTSSVDDTVSHTVPAWSYPTDFTMPELERPEGLVALLGDPTLTTRHAVLDLAFNDAGALVATDMMGVHVWSIDTRERLQHLEAASASVMALSWDGARAAGLERSGQLTVWDVVSGTVLHTLEGSAHCLTPAIPEAQPCDTATAEPSLALAGTHSQIVIEWQSGRSITGHGHSRDVYEYASLELWDLDAKDPDASITTRFEHGMGRVHALPGTMHVGLGQDTSGQVVKNSIRHICWIF